MSTPPDNTTATAVSIAQAHSALRARLPRLAQQHLRAALASDPSSREARLLMARVCLALDDPKSAMDSLNALDLYDPEHRDEPERRFARIEALARLSMDDVAITELRRVAGEYPDDPRPRRLLAVVQERLGQIGEAVRSLREAVRLEPTDNALRVTLAKLAEYHAPDTAIDALAPAAQDTGSRHWLARLLRRVGRLRESVEMYDALCATAEGDQTLLHEAGVVHAEQGDTRGAVARLTAVIEASGGKDTAAMMALARVQMHAGQFPAAGRLWWRVARITPECNEAWAGLAACAMAVERWSLALRAMRPLSIHACRAERQKLLAGAWIDAAAGIAVRKAIQRMEPKETLHHTSQLDRMLAMASTTLEEHLAQFPRRADMHYHLAVCRSAVGDTTTAEKALCDALLINPRYDAAKRLSEDLSKSRRAA